MRREEQRQRRVEAEAARLREVARLDDMQPRRGFSAVNLGEQPDFAYDIGASVTDEVERGFDALRLRTGGRTVFKRLEMGQPLAPVEPRSVQLEDNALVVVLPRAVTAQDNSFPIRHTGGHAPYAPRRNRITLIKLDGTVTALAAMKMDTTG